MNSSNGPATTYDGHALASTNILAACRRMYWPAMAIFLLIHFPARLFAHLSISRSGLRDYWPHPIAGMVIANAVLLVSFVLVEGAVVAYAASSHRSLNEAVRTAFHRLPALLLARLLYVLAVSAGLLLLVVPGVLIAIWFSTHAWFVIIERESAIGSFRRSFSLVRGRVGRMLRAFLPAMIFCLAWLMVGFSLVGFLLRQLRPFPVFKIAPLLMTIVETGIIVPIIAGGVMFYRYRQSAQADEALS